MKAKIRGYEGYILSMEGEPSYGFRNGFEDKTDIAVTPYTIRLLASAYITIDLLNVKTNEIEILDA